MKGRVKSSHYDPYSLGYTCATKVNTIRSYKVTWSNSIKFTVCGLIIEIHYHEGGIISNRKLECYGEI